MAEKTQEELAAEANLNAARINPDDNATNFDIANFEALLNRLEASKKRQQRQKSVEGRKDIFATGLAGMMGNF
tara:strand:+ start:841 stop:1059 length:219 start_codon:yes stop_codon:yes gene_type:complete